MDSTNDNINYFNIEAEFWYREIGVNVFPADTINKKPLVEWKQWQNKPLPEEVFLKWKELGLYDKGLAIIPGLTYRGKNKGLYFVFIDADKQEAISELCTRNGKTISLEELATQLIVEQHKNDLNRAHLFFYSPIPFEVKGSDSILGLEVKSLGNHGIAFVSPSIRSSGYRYEIIGTRDPKVLTRQQAIELIQHLDQICMKYGLQYLEKSDLYVYDSFSNKIPATNNNNNSNRIRSSLRHIIRTLEILPLSEKIKEGERHTTLISVANSLLFTHIKKKKSIDELYNFFLKLNDEFCETEPLPNNEINSIWTSAVNFYHQNHCQEIENNNNRENVKEEQKAEVQQEELANIKLEKEDIPFISVTIKKEAPYDEISIKQLFYGMASTFTKIPIPHEVNSRDSGAGKSYLLNLVAGYFPEQYVMLLTGSSDKAFFHKDGPMVIENYNTGEIENVEPLLAKLNSDIEDLNSKIEEKAKDTKSRDKNLIAEYKNKIKTASKQIKEIENKAEKLIDLDNQIIIYQDTPNESLFDTLMALMSQDTPKDQKYTFVEKTGSNKLRTKVNRLRGMPCLFTSQVIDDTTRKRFEEKNRRFINVSPETSKEKVSSAKNLIGLRYGSLQEEYDELVVSRQDKEKARNLVRIVIAKLKKHSKFLKPKESGVKIPFAVSIMNAIPDDHVWNMTVAERFMKYLSIGALINIDNRPKIIDIETGQIFPIAIFEDLKEALLLMERAATGIRSYLVQWYNNVFLEAFEDQEDQPKERRDSYGYLDAKEKVVAVTTEELAEKTLKKFGGKKLGSKDILNKYLYPLENHGIIDKVKSEIDNRNNIYFPVNQGNLFSLFNEGSDIKLKIRDLQLYPTKKYIEESFRTIIKYSSEECIQNKNNFSKYKLIDSDGKEIDIEDLINKYFSNPQDYFTIQKQE